MHTLKEGPFSTHRIRHCNPGVGHEFDFAFARQVYVNYSVVVVADLQFFVRPQVVLFSVLICFTNNALKITDKHGVKDLMVTETV